MRPATAFAALVVVLLALGGVAALALGVPWGSGTGSASPDLSLTCTVKASCDGGAGEVEVFRMAALDNAHAGTPGGSSYPNVVCCGGVTGLGTSCSGNYDTVLGLSDTDNAHVATIAAGPYTTEVCLSVPSGPINCTHASTCPDGYACLATISATTSAAVADCDEIDDYATKVCCSDAAAVECPDPGSVPWSVPSGDADCDGFTTDIENYLVTDSNDPCANDSTQNNEDPPDMWPTDFNDDQRAAMQDVIFGFVTTLAPIGLNQPASGPLVRVDFNGNGWINMQDVILGYVTRLAPVGLNAVCAP